MESETPKKKSNLGTFLAVIVLVVIAGFLFMNKNNLVATKEFTVDGSNYAFDPKTITVNKGDVVKINFKDDDGMHNLVVDGYNVKTETIKSGNTSSVTFTADKTGTFEYYCSVSTHKDKGMTGTLTVTDTPQS